MLPSARAVLRSVVPALLAAALLVAPQPARATVGVGDASCGCPETGPYTAPAGVTTAFVDDDGGSAPSNPRYHVAATGALPAIQLTVRRSSDNAVVLSTTTNLSDWGFSPDQDRFVITGIDNGLHAIRLYNLLAPTPAAPVWQLDTTEDSGRLGFSPHGEFFAFTAIQDGTANTVNARVVDARTGSLRHQATYTFSVPFSNGKPFGEAGYGFSPDDDEFFYAWVSAQQVVQTTLVDLDAGVARHSSTITGTGFWQFSPCGDVLALVTQNDQVSMQVQLINTDTGAIASSTSYPVGTVTFETTATHHRATVDGTPHDLVPVFPPVPDVCPPTWPPGAAVQATGMTATGAHLAWSAADDDTAVTGYRVFRGATQVAQVAGDVLEADVTGLSADTTYTFRIQAGDAAGHWTTDGPSVPVTTTGAQPTWPAPKSLTASAVTATGLHLAWSAATDNVGVAHYRVSRAGTQIAELPPGTRVLDVTGLARGSRYTFRVEAVDGDGLESTDGPTLTVNTSTLAQVGTASISGRLWQDNNMDGVQGGEPGIQTDNNETAIRAYRIGAAREVLEQRATSSNAAGDYAFTGLEPGTWVVVVLAYDVFNGGRLQSLPASEQPWELVVGTSSGWTGADVGLSTERPIPLPGEGNGTIAGTVYNDADGDGTHDAGETGVPDASVGCYHVNTWGGPGCTTTTGASGAFSLGSMTPGSYELQAGPPSGWYRTGPDQRLAVVPTGGTTGGHEFGMIQGLSTISGDVFHDQDGDGVRDPGEGGFTEAVDLTVCVSGARAGDCMGVNAAGHWAVGQLPPGDYTVDLSPRSWTQTLPAGDATRPVTVTTNGNTVVAGDFGVDGDFGIVAGRTWHDTDGDGVADPGEPGLAGVRLCLSAAGEEQTDCRTSRTDDPGTPADEAGRFRFGYVPAGTAQLRADAPPDMAQTFPAEGDTDVTVVANATATADHGFDDVGTAVAPGPPVSPTTAPGRARVDLAWQAPTDDGGGTVSEYVVQRATSAGGTWVDAGRTSGTSLRVTGLVNGQRAFFRIAAVNEAGQGAWSAVVSAVSRTVASAPRRPTAAARSRAVLLTWSRPASTGGAAVTDYVLQRARGRSGRWTTVRDGVGTTRRHVVTGLVAGTRYRFRVSARNTAGTGAWSAVVSAAPRR